METKVFIPAIKSKIDKFNQYFLIFWMVNSIFLYTFPRLNITIKTLRIQYLLRPILWSNILGINPMCSIGIEQNSTHYMKIMIVMSKISLSVICKLPIVVAGRT